MRDVACDANCKQDKQILCLKILSELYEFDDQGVHERIILKWILYT